MTTMEVFKYDDLVALLTCMVCNQFCGTSIVQCRKGHVICKSCKTSHKITSCKTCKQTFVDAPNVVLDKMINMIALPCRFRSHGCADFLFVDVKIEHETLCHYRPMICQYAPDGCPEEMTYKDMCLHQKKCQFNPKNK